jgi:hypothetical protein
MKAPRVTRPAKNFSLKDFVGRACYQRIELLFRYDHEVIVVGKPFWNDYCCHIFL